MTTPDPNEIAATETPSDDDTERELSLEDLNDVAGGGVVVHDRQEQETK
jgi:hypothetical protein